MDNLTRYWNKQPGDDNRLGFHQQKLSVRTISDLNTAILLNLSLFQEIDCIVGIPRSGLLVASMIALHVNIPLIHLNDFLAGNLAQSYTRRRSIKHKLIDSNTKPLNVLVVDDSTGFGVTFSDIKRKFASLDLDNRYNLRYMSAYCSDIGVAHVDLFLEKVPFPRIFEWNLLHMSILNIFASIWMAYCAMIQLLMKMMMVKITRNFVGMPNQKSFQQES